MGAATEARLTPATESVPVPASGTAPVMYMDVRRSPNQGGKEALRRSPRIPPGMMIAHEGGAPPMLSPSSDRVMATLNKLSMANEQTWIAIGSTAESMSDPTRAMAAYDSALLHNPYSIPALSAMASLYRSMEHFDLAIEYIQRVLDIDRENGEVWGAMGHCYLMMDELEKAYAAYQQALCHLPNAKEPKLWYGIGILYDRCGNLEHAEETFSSVVRMNPDYEKANEIYFRLGIIYKQQGRYDSSLECFRYILQNPPKPLTEMDIWFQIGHVYEQRHEYDLAKEAYERVLRENTNHGKVLQQLGALYLQPESGMFDQEKALRLLHQSIDSDKNDQQTWYLLGRAYMGSHEYNKAYDSYQQAVYRDGKNPVLWGSIGVLYFQIGQFHDALGAFSRSIRQNPYIPEIWFNLGILYESCNNQISDAIDAYRRTLELDPDHTEVQHRLTILQNAEKLGHSVPNIPEPKELPFSAFSTCILPPSEGSPMIGDAEETGWTGESAAHHAKEGGVPGSDEVRQLTSEASPRRMKFYDETSGQSPMPHMQFAKAQSDFMRDTPTGRAFAAPPEWDRYPYHDESAGAYSSRRHPMRMPNDSRGERLEPGYFNDGTRPSYPVSSGSTHLAHRDVMSSDVDHDRARVDKELQLRRKRDMANLRRPVSTLRSNQSESAPTSEFVSDREDASSSTMRSAMPVSSSREIDEDYDTGAASALMGLAGAAASAYEANNLSRTRSETLSSPKSKRILDSDHVPVEAKRPRSDEPAPNGDYEPVQGLSACMGLLGHVGSAVMKTDGKFSSQDQAPEGAHADDTEELNEEHGNILLSLISQLRIGKDLSKVTLPTFVLEPRSMLERVTDFLSHPDILFDADRMENPEERFLAILTYYMSGWHIKPKGVKKPYNPVLGEFFRCTYTYPNGTHGVYIAEQVSHHPPISAYYYVSPENNVLIYGDLRPKSKFLGNSAATIMGGESRVVLLNKLADGEYTISMPNMYARGIMFGKMVFELGDQSNVTNVANDISCHIDFKVKGYFGGTYNAIGAKINHHGRTTGELTGKWSEAMEYKDTQTGKSRVLFDAKSAATVQKHAPPLEEQEPNESRRSVLPDAYRPASAVQYFATKLG
ncbi:hypothetical protein MCAP1_000088 [Malassezia caprae]|uniref:Uncharacterized protein n=1 Tax=Malassezia caprae TaxID=1381934 RepID=A0AAF0E495_9BASI|nr:hypothetical protein MCAP1_000088 [Malassezia caprae]